MNNKSSSIASSWYTFLFIFQPCYIAQRFTQENDIFLPYSNLAIYQFPLNCMFFECIGEQIFCSWAIIKAGVRSSKQLPISHSIPKMGGNVHYHISPKLCSILRPPPGTPKPAGRHAPPPSQSDQPYRAMWAHTNRVAELKKSLEAAGNQSVSKAQGRICSRVIADRSMKTTGS
jgi:hypothetical protein